MDILLFYKISSLINALVATVLGFVIYFRNRKQLANKLFSLFFAFVAIWSYSIWFFWSGPRNSNLILADLRYFLMGSAIFIPILFFHAVIVFANNIKKYRKFLIIGYLIFFVFLLVDYFTPFLVKNVKEEIFFSFTPQPGTLFVPFLFAWYFYLTLSFYILVDEIKNVSSQNSGTNDYYKIQLKSILIGAVIGFLGSVPNYLMWYSSYGLLIAPFVNFLVAIGMIIVALGIIRHQLFNVKLLASEVLVFAIWAITVVRTVLSNNNSELLINGILVLLVFVVGILLLRSVSKEKEPTQKLLEETQKTLDLEWSLRNEFIDKSRRLIKIMENAVDESEERNKKLKKKSK